MSQIVERPGGIVLEEILEESVGAFGNTLYLIGMGPDKYAANNVTLPDGQNVNGLATFPSPDDATTYMALLAGLSGEIVKKSFEEAREIAKSKPSLICMLFFVDGKIVDVHYVK